MYQVSINSQFTGQLTWRRYCQHKKLAMLALACLVLLSKPSMAEVLPAYFGKDSARTVFEGPINTTKAQQPLMLVPKPVKLEQEEKVKKENATKANSNQFRAETDRRLAQPKDREGILSTYGDPTKPYPVAAVTDAPAPFKGLMAALSAGDDELAFKYAIQYTRYQEQVRDNSRKVVGYLGQAQRREGMLSENSWADSPEFTEYTYLQDLALPDFEEAAKQEQKSIKAGTQDIQATAKKLIEQIKTGGYDLFEERKKAAVQELGKWEQLERVKTRQELAGKLPVSTSGRLDVFLFFRGADQYLSELTGEMNKLQQELGENKLVNIAAFSVESANPSFLNKLRQQSSAEFPILPGRELSQKLGLKTTPVIIFSTDQGHSHVETGLVNYFRLSEIVKIMQGVS